MKKLETLFLIAAVVAVWAVQHPVAAQTCNVYQLFPCSGAISGLPPTTMCCERLQEQQPCFCQYLKDPTLSQYFTQEVADRLAAACKVTIPTNCP